MKREEGKPQQTRKATAMKKASLQSLVSYLNGETVDNIAEIKAEIEAELAKGAEKAQANRDLYAAAREVVLAAMTEAPQSVAEIFAACEENLPEGFSKGKVQYALMNYWTDAVVKIENPYGPNQYRLK